MPRNISALIAHILVLAALLTTFGCMSLKRDDSEGQSKFNGELERNVTLRILENDTAKEKGYFKELLDAFNAAYAEYGIVAVDANMDQYTDLEQDGPYGYGPDVLYQANDALMKYAHAVADVLKLPQIVRGYYRRKVAARKLSCKYAFYRLAHHGIKSVKCFVAEHVFSVCAYAEDY